MCTVSSITITSETLLKLQRRAERDLPEQGRARVGGRGRVGGERVPLLTRAPHRRAQGQTSCFLSMTAAPTDSHQTLYVFMEEPSQFSLDQTAQSLTCSIMEKQHTGLGDCLRMLLACFRKRMSVSRPRSATRAAAASPPSSEAAPSTLRSARPGSGP